MPQFTLPLALTPEFCREQFHRLAVQPRSPCLDYTLARWPSHTLLLLGPEGSGKTHLAHIWAQNAGSDQRVAEDIERMDEHVLLHLFNYSKELGKSLLMTAAGNLPFTLPDLTSRLRAIPHAVIGEPDDALLEAVMRKQFSDRQLLVDNEVIAYLIPRIERTLSKVKELVATIDQAALAERKKITVPFVRALLSADHRE